MPPKTYEILRRTIDWAVDTYKLLIELPKDTTIWRMHNTDDNEIYWGDNEHPNLGTDTQYETLEGHSSDIPPITPVKVYATRTTTDTSPVIVVIWTTSKDPNVMARVANMSFGAVISDVQIGAVEIKDSAGTQRVTVTSGADGINRFNVIVASGMSINAVVLSGISVVEEKVILGSGAMMSVGASCIVALASRSTAVDRFIRNVSPVATTINFGYLSSVTASNAPIVLYFGDQHLVENYIGPVYAVMGSGTGTISVGIIG